MSFFECKFVSTIQKNTIPKLKLETYESHLAS